MMIIIHKPSGGWDVHVHRGHELNGPVFFSDPHPLAPQHVDGRRGREAGPLADGAERPAHLPALLEAPPEEAPRLGEVGRAVVGHEQLGRHVDGRQRGSLGVPGRVDGPVAGQEEDLVGEQGQLVQRAGDVCRVGHDGEGLLCRGGQHVSLFYFTFKLRRRRGEEYESWMNK